MRGFFAYIQRKRTFPKLSALFFVCNLALALFLWPSSIVVASFGDDPQSYGETLVYDNITTNPDPGNGFGGGYNGYPAANGIQMVPGMYKVLASFQGSSVAARIYAKAGNGPCTDLFAGAQLDPSNPAGYVAVMPADGDMDTIETICTAINIHAINGLSVRVQIWRVFASPQTIHGSSYFGGEYAVGATGSVQIPSPYQAVYYDQSFTVSTAPLTITLEVLWSYHLGGVESSTANADPQQVQPGSVSSNDCVFIVAPSGSEPVGPDRVCANDTSPGTLYRTGTYHIRVPLAAETATNYIYRVSAFVGAGLPTPTATLSPTASPIPTPGPGCSSYQATINTGVDSLVDIPAGSYQMTLYWPASSVYNTGNEAYIIADFDGLYLTTSAHEENQSSYSWHIQTIARHGGLVVASGFTSGIATLFICPDPPTPTPTAISDPCPASSASHLIIPASPGWQIIPMQPSFYLFAARGSVSVEYPYNSQTLVSLPLTPVLWSTIGVSGWYRFYSAVEGQSAELGICQPAPTATPTTPATNTSTTTNTALPTATATATSPPTATPTATTPPSPTATPGSAFPSPVPTICVVAGPTPFANVGPAPDLSFNLPPITVLTDTVTTTIQISVTAIIGTLYQMKDGIGTPVTMLQTVTGQFRLESGQTAVSGMFTYIQPGLGWLSILNPQNPAYFSGGGPLWALAPVLRPLLPIVITTMLVSFVRLLIWFISFIVSIIETMVKIAAVFA